MEGGFKEIIKRTRKRSLFSIFVSGNGSIIKTNFSTPIILDEDRDYSVALTSLHTWYSFANVDPKNSKFIYFDKVSWKEVILPTGVYDITDLDTRLQLLLPIKNVINIYGDQTTLKAVLIIQPGYKVKFPDTGGLSKLLGFKPGVYDSGAHQGSDIVLITSCNTCLVKTDLIQNSYVRGEKENIIHCFNVSNLPGTRIIIEPRTLIYYPLAIKQISHFTVELLDQDLQNIDLRGEFMSVNFDIRES